MISGNRIRLRAIEREDLALFVTWLNDPQVLEGLSLYFPLSNHVEERWFENMMQKPAEEHPLMIEVKEDNNWVSIGDIGLMNLDWRNRSAELGIQIGDKNYWDHGYGSEAIKLFLRHSFETLNLNRVTLRVFETNLRARHVYQKIGFVQEGVLRKAFYQQGRYIDEIVMSVLKSEWDHANEESGIIP